MKLGKYAKRSVHSGWHSIERQIVKEQSPTTQTTPLDPKYLRSPHYKCSKCDKEFSQLGSCNDHIVEKHEGDGYAKQHYDY